MEVYNFLNILFRIIKHINEYKKGIYLQKFVCSCNHTTDLINEIINYYYLQFICQNFAILFDETEFKSKMDKIKLLSIDNEFVKQYLMEMIDLVYSDSVLFSDSEMDELNIILLGILLK
jgi:hypothetical protein